MDDELDKVIDELEQAQGKHQKDTENMDDFRERGRSEFIRRKVREQLGRRIPRMVKIEESEEHQKEKQDGAQADAAQNDGKDKHRGGQKQKGIHNHVLVSYFNGIGSDEYQVAYRIDKSITVSQLHRDCCSYWGCSHNEYVLCTTTDDEAGARMESSVKPLWSWKEDEDPSEQLNQTLLHDTPEQSVLKPHEKAQLHLVSKEKFGQFQAQQDAARAENKAKQQTQETAEDPNTIKSLKYGYVANEGIAEPFVEALKPWPGMHTLLKNRDRVRLHKWSRSRLRDFVTYGVLLILTAASLNLRSTMPMYIIREGAVQA